MHNLSNVRLPEKFWQQAQNNEELTEMARKYIAERYPDYTPKKIVGRFAVCEINR